MARERAWTTTQKQQRATANNESMRAVMRATTKMVRAARAMVTTMMVPGNKDGKGGEGHGIGNKWCATKRAMATEARTIETRAGK